MEFAIGGMHCAACSSRIERVVSGMEGVERVSVSLAAETASLRLAPGADADKVESFGEDTPMKRPGEPNEVAPCFLFLACEDASYMSGQILHPNGGVPVGG